MKKLGMALYIDEVEVLENELEEYKNIIVSKIGLFSHKGIKYSWEEDKVIYSYTLEGWCMDKDEEKKEILKLTQEQREVIYGFKKVIEYYKNKN